jgi:hypothetical protein
VLLDQGIKLGDGRQPLGLATLTEVGRQVHVNAAVESTEPTTESDHVNVRDLSRDGVEVVDTLKRLCLNHDTPGR